VKKKLYFATLPLIITACSHLSLASRHDTADGITAPASLVERIIPAGPFNLTSWSRMTKFGAPARVYIEGDGLAWVSRSEESLNPTPPDPLALRLAAADKSDNVVYLARPCQYTGLSAGGPCPDTYWTQGKTAPEVIDAYEKALDAIKAQYGITGFELIGYSGGAAVAVLAAAGRQDVASIRTVAGNTNYAVFTALHKIDAISGSLKPEDTAEKLARVPQVHFIGSDDKTVPMAVFNGWKQASHDASCLRADIVDGAAHDKGWAEKWPELLKLAPSCNN